MGKKAKPKLLKGRDLIKQFFDNIERDSKRNQIVQQIIEILQNETTQIESSIASPSFPNNNNNNYNKVSTEELFTASTTSATTTTTTTTANYIYENEHEPCLNFIFVDASDHSHRKLSFDHPKSSGSGGGSSENHQSRRLSISKPSDSLLRLGNTSSGGGGGGGGGGIGGNADSIETRIPLVKLFAFTKLLAIQETKNKHVVVEILGLLLKFSTDPLNYFIEFYFPTLQKNAGHEAYHLLILQVLYFILAPENQIKFNHILATRGIISVILKGLCKYFNESEENCGEMISSVFDLILTSYPSEFQLEFTAVVDIYIGWIIDPKVGIELKALIFNNFKWKYWTFWGNSLSYGIDLLKNLCFDLQEIFSLSLDPEADTNSTALRQIPFITSNGVALFESCIKVYDSIVYSCYPSVNPRCQYNNQIINPQILIALDVAAEWILNISSTIAFNPDLENLNLMKRWLELVYEMLGICFSALSVDSRIYIKTTTILINHHHILSERISKGLDPKAQDFTNWIRMVFTCFQNSPLNVPRAVLEWFQIPEPNNFVLNHYRVLIADQASSLERLAETCNLFAVPFKNQILSVNPKVSTFATETCLIVEWMTYLMDQSLPKPACSQPFKTISLMRYSKLLLFDIACSEFVTPNVKNRTLHYRHLYKLIEQISADSALWQRHPFFHLIQTDLVKLLYKQCKANSFFLPRLSVSDPATMDEKENIGVILGQIEMVRMLVSTAHLGNIQIGLRWSDDLVGYCSERNVVDTDVQDSFVLLVLEGLLVDILNVCGTMAEAVCRAGVGKVWLKYLQQFSSNRRGSSNSWKIMELLIERFYDVDDAVQDIFTRCFYTLDPFDSLLSLDQLRTSSSKGTSRIERFKKLVMSSPPSFFSPIHFALVSSYLGLNSRLTDSGSPQTQYLMTFAGLDSPLASWLPDLFHTTQANIVLLNSASSQDSVLIQVAANSLDFLLFWALWEAARFCILNKLKTPLGDAVQTLDSFHHVINKYTSLSDTGMHSNASQSQFNCALDLFKRQADFSIFLELLEVQIEACATGCCSTFPSPPKSCILFFYNNQRVCRDWFLRVLMKRTCLASDIENDACVIRLGFMALEARWPLLYEGNSRSQDIVSAEIRRLFFKIREAFVRSKDFDGIQGFTEYWISKVVSFRGSDMFDDSFLLLLEASALQAQNCIEESTLKYEMLLQQVQSICPTGYKRILEDEIINGYGSLHDWDHLGRALCEVDLRQDAYRTKLDFLQVWDISKPPPFAKNETCPNFGEGISSVIEKFVAMELLTFRHNNSVQADTELSQNLLQIKKVATYTSGQLSVVAQRLLVGQSLSKASSVVNVGKNQIKLRKAKPKDRITSTSILPNCLQEWLKAYDILRVFDRSKGVGKVDLDLDDVGGLLSNLSRKTFNFGLARKLLDYCQASPNSCSLRTLFKNARLLEAQKDKRAGCLALLDVLLIKPGKDNLVDIETHAKACSFLCKWGNVLDFKEPAVAVKISQILPKALKADFSPDMPHESFLRYSTIIGPKLPKSWFNYAGFRYIIGRKMLDDLHRIADVDYQSTYFSNEYGRIKEIFQNCETPDQKLEESFFISVLEGLGEKRGTASGSSGSLWKLHLPESSVEILESIQDSITSTVLKHFESATEAYFRFLHIQGAQNEKDRITCTLRLLRIFVKYGSLLEALFTQQFKSSPISAWIGVIPQLLSRLHSPDSVVRRQLCELLCLIGSKYSHLILYPVLIGVEQKTTENIATSYNYILEFLMGTNPQLVQEMNTWMLELRKITVLWEEIWLNGLDRVKYEILECNSKLQKDLVRVKANTSLAVKEQNDIIEKNTESYFMPILFNIDQLVNKTIRKGACSDHEKDFLDKFGDPIMAAIENLAQKRDFEEFQKLRDKIVEFGSKGKYSLEHLNPYLHSLSGTLIQMPGTSNIGSTLVESVFDQVLLIATKTKPKKIQLLSCDGVSYPFLLKGNEDLNLDQRIQQFISVANALMEGDKQSSGKKLSGRTYAVIPFGPRFGMIQWINGVSGIFNLYQKWQYWDHAAKSLQKKVSTMPRPPLKPHEQYLLKIQRAMGGQVPKNRKNWNPEIVKAVFHELQNETPSNILHKELWGRSTSSKAWYGRSVRYSQSLAVMSILGYVLGLGDRHLDNILIDAEGGEVIHIDFNVCFEKGKFLRIPETVPFRLTQNLVMACGPNGVDGSFRASCEQTLRVVRENKEIILNLLETFVYDPLVDWTKDNGSERNILDLNVNIGLFLSRFDEYRSALDDLVEQIPIGMNTFECEIESLASGLEMRQELSLEKEQISSFTPEDISESILSLTQKFQESKESLSQLLNKFKAKSERNRAFLDIYKTRLSEIDSDDLGYLENVDLNLSPSLANEWKELKKQRLGLFQSLKPVINWFSEVYGRNELVFIPDFYETRSKIIEDLMNDGDYSMRFCNTAVSRIKNLSSRIGGLTIRLDSEYAAVIEKKRAILKRLEKRSSSILVAGSDTVDPSEISTQMLKCVAVYLWSELGRTIYALSIGGENSTFYSNLMMNPELVDLATKEPASRSFLENSIAVALIVVAFSSLKKFITKQKCDETIGEMDNIEQNVSLTVSEVGAIHSLLWEKVFPLSLRIRLYNESSDFLSAFSDIGSKSRKYLLMEGKEDLALDLLREVGSLLNNQKNGCAVELLESLLHLYGHFESSSKNSAYLFLRLLSVVSDLFLEVISKPHLRDADPACEFGCIFDTKRLLEEFPELLQGFNSMKSFEIWISREMIYTPLLNNISENINRLLYTSGKSLAKGWSSSLGFSENTSIPIVDRARRYLNNMSGELSFNRKDLDLSLEKVMQFAKDSEMQGYFAPAIIAHENSIKCKEEAHKRFRVLNTVALLNEVKSPIIKEPLKVVTKLKSSLAELKVYNEAVGFIIEAVNSEDNSNLILQEINATSILIDFLEKFAAFESDRIDSSFLKRIDGDIILTIDQLLSTKRRLNSIGESGISGSLQDIQDQLNSLTVSESITSTERLTRKTHSLMDTVKSIIDPLLANAESILLLAKDSNFPTSDIEMITATLALWKKCKIAMKHISVVRKEPGFLEKPSGARKLRSHIASLTADLKNLLGNIFALSKLKPHEENEASSDAVEEQPNADAVEEQPNAIQSRNITAVNVLLRIKEKLDGRDYQNAPLSISEHVQKLVNDSINNNNLAIMYEGWMAWI